MESIELELTDIMLAWTVSRIAASEIALERLARVSDPHDVRAQLLVSTLLEWNEESRAAVEKFQQFVDDNHAKKHLN